jgi:uncharacterized protein YegL
LLPSSWTEIENTTKADGIIFEDGNIRVDQTSGVYGNSPFTVQARGCGEPGEYIQVSAHMLQLENFTDTFGPPGQTFVHEWAKYRYGVFEEHGYPGDEQFPMFYIKKTQSTYGEVNALSPNFCINTDVKYTMGNVNGGNCLFDEKTGLPDSNCIIFLVGDNGVDSSIMALPFLNGNYQFCENDGTLYHDKMLPSKHNKICSMQSTFSIIQKHNDFHEYTKINRTHLSPEYNLLIPKTSSSYVLVLDVSRIMSDFDRIQRMINSAVSWIKHYVQDNVRLGIVQFSTQAKTHFNLTNISDEVRENMKTTLSNLTPDGDTCIGAGVAAGIKTLSEGDVLEGGVIILVTAGYQQCEGSDTLNITHITDEAAKQKCRIILISLGNQVDAEIVQLAEKTNGKAFFVPDETGPEHMNDAFQNLMAFQPSDQANKQDIVIAKEIIKKVNFTSFPFWIDDTVGDAVYVQIDFSEDVNCTIVIANISDNFSSHKFENVYKKQIGELETGKYFVTILSSSIIEYASVTVTSRSKAGKLPITVHCMTNVGAKQADLSDNSTSTIVIMAQVLQGSNPVLKAKVTASLEFDDPKFPLDVELFDQGATPDNIKDDGIYSRYFTSFLQEEKDMSYTLKCHVEGTEESVVNLGFSDAQSRQPYFLKTRSLPKQPSRDFPICCGSSTVHEKSVLAPTGQFSRVQTGEMLRITKADKVTYPPGTVNDLIAGGLNLSAKKFEIRFTAPGDKLDSGIVPKYKIHYSLNMSTLMDLANLDNVSYLIQASTSLKPVKPGEIISLLERTEMLPSGNEPVQYFFRLKASAGELSSVSNIARLFMGKYTRPYQEPGLTPGAMAGIVIGTMLTVLLVLAAGYWYRSKIISK